MEKSNIQSKEIECTGCSACASICPLSCITMKEDKEGFRFPSINSKCVNCGQCIQVCPAYNSSAVETKTIKLAYKSVSKLREKESSASGGIFYTLAKTFLEEGGVVFGCAFDDNFHVKHVSVQAVENLSRLQGSKYVQSNLDHIFVEVKTILRDGGNVLFSGTPCQIAGLYLYLSQQDVNTENLYTIDLICHGVGSPGLWNVCIDQRRHSKEIRAIRFRVKSRYDKSSFKLKINYADNSCELLNGQEDIFFSGFLSNYSLRRSCYKCNYANEHRIGDITLGDCATAIDYEETDFKPYEAVSTVLINSEKGKRLWDKSQDMVEYQLLDLKKEKGQNHQLSHATVYPIERDHYFQDEAVSAILSRKSVSLKQRLPLATYMRLYIAGCMTIRTRYKIKRISKQIKKLMIRS